MRAIPSLRIVLVCPYSWDVPGGVQVHVRELSAHLRELGHEVRVLAPGRHRGERDDALIVGRALKELTPLVVQASLIVLLTVPFGFALYPLQAVVGLLMLGVLGVGIGALSYALAIATRKTEWIFWAVQQTLLFPLLILSGMMLPLEAGPGWMQVAARFNPLTYVVDAERTLFAGAVDVTVVYGFLAALLTAAVGLWVGVRAIRTATL